MNTSIGTNASVISVEKLVYEAYGVTTEKELAKELFADKLWIAPCGFCGENINLITAEHVMRDGDSFKVCPHCGWEN